MDPGRFSRGRVRIRFFMTAGSGFDFFFFKGRIRVNSNRIRNPDLNTQKIVFRNLTYTLLVLQRKFTNLNQFHFLSLKDYKRMRQKHVRGFGGFDSDPTLKKRNRIRIRRSRKKIDPDLNSFNFDPVLFFY